MADQVIDIDLSVNPEAQFSSGRGKRTRRIAPFAQSSMTHSEKHQLQVNSSQVG